MFSRNKKYLEKANFLPLLEVDIYQYKRKKKKTPSQDICTQEYQQHIPYNIYINSGSLNIKTMENLHRGLSYRHGY